MGSGFEYALPGGGEVRVRRCYDDDEQIVEFSIESFIPYWSIVSLALSPEQAALIGSFLSHEAAVPIAEGGHA